MIFNKENFIVALRKLGLKRGDNVFSHGNIGFFGYPEETENRNEISRIILNSFLNVIGDKEHLLCLHLLILLQIKKFKIIKKQNHPAEFLPNMLENTLYQNHIMIQTFRFLQ